jgi:hypothetical protein
LNVKPIQPGHIVTAKRFSLGSSRKAR